MKTDLQNDEILEIEISEASAAAIQENAKTSWAGVMERFPSFGIEGTSEEFLKERFPKDNERIAFMNGVNSVIANCFTKIKEDVMQKIRIDKMAKHTLAESVFQLANSRIIPNIRAFYIAPRQTKAGSGKFSFKIEMQYQAKIEALENVGIEIIRIEYISTKEYVHGETITYPNGELYINHIPNYKDRSEVVKGQFNAIIAYLVYLKKNTGEIKFYHIDFEKIENAKSKSKKTTGDKWTGSYGCRITCVHNFYNEILNKSIDDYDPYLYSEEEERIIKSKRSMLESPSDIEDTLKKEE